MPGKRFKLLFGTALLVIYGAFWAWQTPGVFRGPLGAAEIDALLERASRNLAMPADERAAAMERLRAWAQADDGEPFFMLNLMRYYPEVRRFEGAPAFSGSPEQANARYEDRVMPLLFGVGGYPIFGGRAQGANVLGVRPEMDDWSRILLVRYPSRRAFLELVVDPRYGPIEPYKLMALDIVLTPAANEIVVPELRWTVAGVLLLLFLCVCPPQRRR